MCSDHHHGRPGSSYEIVSGVEKHLATLNEAFSTLSIRRRYEVWFLRLGLADGSGAWWFRYLLMNPGRDGCAANPRGLPVQVWATWFPAGGKPQSFIQGFPLQGFEFSGKGQTPFHFRIGDNAIEEDFCRGSLDIDGHSISWNLRYRSTYRVTLSNKGWIGFSRTPHSDAVFSGQITLDGRNFSGDPLGFGVQGHNCGYRHRNFWTWTHAYFPRTGKPASTLEALAYEMPFGLIFRKAVLWHDGQEHVFQLKETAGSRETMRWNFRCAERNGFRLEAAIDGRSPSLHRLPYIKTDCTGSFEVANNSLASASLVLDNAAGTVEKLETATGAVLEMVG
jgi:hypothetical protein